MKNCTPPPLRPQRGASLVIALVMLAMILLLGTAGVSLLALDEHGARNHRAHQHAMFAAQAALDLACEQIRADGSIQAGVPQAGYLIDWRDPAPGADEATSQAVRYRINATGTGPGGASAALQAVVRREQGVDGATRCVRLSWRTIPPHPPQSQPQSSSP